MDRAEMVDVWGALDRLDSFAAEGWVQSRSRPQDRLSVFLEINGVVVEETLASSYRQDLVDAGTGDGCYGFNFDVRQHLGHGGNFHIRIGVVGSEFRFDRVLELENFSEHQSRILRVEDDAAVFKILRNRKAERRGWSGDASVISPLLLEGWLFSHTEPDHVFLVEAHENGRVIARASTGCFCDFAPEDLGRRTGFRLQLPVSLLDGSMHHISLLVDGESTEFADIDIDGADTGIGFVDTISSRSVQGWALSHANPSEPAEVEVFCGDILYGRGTAHKFRMDLAGLLNMNGFQGFEVKLDKPIFIEDLPNIIVRLANGGVHLPLSDEAEAEAKKNLEPKPAKPRLKGHVDKVDVSGVSGWAYDIDNPDRGIRVDIAINDIVVGGVLADAHRADLAKTFGTNGKHGFHIGFPPGLGLRGKVDIKVYFAETRQLISKQDMIFEGYQTHTALIGKAAEQSLDLYLYRRISGLVAAKLPSVHLVVLNRNGAEHLYNFFESFKRYNTYRNYRITIVDHGSVDESEKVVSHWKRFLDVEFINRGKNYSFSQSNNFAVENSDDDIVFFVNNDIVFVQCIVSIMVRYLTDDEVGIVGVKLRSPSEQAGNSLTQDGFIQHLGIKFGATSGANTIGAYELPLHPDASVISNAAWRVPAVTAAALMMRREDFLEVGGFDEGYFYSYEDVDLCLKVSGKLNKQIICANNLVAIHHRGASRSNEDAQTRSRYARNVRYLRSRFGAKIRQDSRRQALSGERFLRLEPLRVAFLVSTVDFDAPEADFFTAYELGGELIHLNGWSVSYLPPRQWYDLADFDVVIAMRQDWDPRKIKKSNPNLVRVAWARNWFDRWIRLPWLEDFDLIWTASIKSEMAFRQVTKRPVEVFRIATNARRFSHARADEHLRSDYCFTGSFFQAPRDILSMLDPKAVPYKFSIFGHNWQEVPWLRPYWQGAMSYLDMPKVYASTSLVVDDCNHTVKNWGSVNSRVFDALVMGTLVVTNGRLGSAEVFDELLPVYETREELTDLLSRYLSDDALREDLISRLRERVLSEHTYRHRAAQAAQSLEKTLGRLRISMRYQGRDSFNVTFGDLVRGELDSSPFWVRDGRILEVEDLGDDVVIWISSDPFPEPVLEPDQINILIHAGTGVNLSAGKFDLAILPDESCNLEKDDTPIIALVRDATVRERCFSRESGVLAFKDARILRRAIIDKMPEIIAFIEKANGDKTALPSSSVSDEERAIDFGTQFRIDVVVYPDYRATNPYQKLLYEGLPSNILIHFADIDRALQMQRAQTNQRTVVFHLHWTSPILGIEPSQQAAKNRLSRFLKTLKEFIAAGGRLAWTIHNVVPHEWLHPELELQLCRDLAQLASTIHVHSSRVPELAGEYYELPSEKVVVGPHGNYIGAYVDNIDKDAARARLKLQAADRVFLFMGQIRSYKGLDRLVAAFKQNTSDAARLLVVGNPVNMSVEEVGRHVASDSRIRLVTGHIADDDLQMYLRAADFCVLPYERVLTSGSVYLALSFGLPVIAPDTGLIPEVIRHGVEGYLYTAGDTNALAAALNGALGCGAGERQRLQENAFARAQELDWDHARQPLFHSVIASTVVAPTLLKVGETWRKIFIRHPVVENFAGARVAAVVLHYAHLDDTIRCVRALLNQQGDNAHVYIVSNDSDADVFRYLCDVFPSCTVIQCDENLGYAGGNNVALQMIRDSQFDFAWVVNPDVIVRRDFLQRMLPIADTNEDTAIFGSQIVFGDRQDVIWFGGGEIDWSNGFEAKHLYLGKKTSEMPAAPFKCEYITGASLFFRRELIEQVGLIPEHYFLYCEETHWCTLANEKGLGIKIFPEIVLLHYKRSEENGAPTPTYLYYLTRASLLFCKTFRPELLQSTEKRLRQTGKIWLEQVRAANPASLDSCVFAFELGISHGLRGVVGRFDFAVEFARQQKLPTGEHGSFAGRQLETL